MSMQRERRPDAPPTEPEGLCSTCMSGTGCSLRHGGGVLECHEFLTAEPAAPTRPLADSVPLRRPTVRTGLCATCEHAVTCTFPAQDGGVWRCEEFR